MPDNVAKEFAEQLASCQGIIGKICRLYGHNTDDRNDLRQDILLNAWRSFPRFRGDSKFSTWLYKVALNTAIGRLRKKSVEVQPLTEAHAGVPASGNEKEEQLEILQRLVKYLTDHEKALIALYLDELSYEEMAAITGLTESNVGVRLNRIKLKLKSVIDHEH